MIVVKISPEIAEEIAGTEYAPGCKYNPVPDANGDLVISIQEAEAGNIEGEEIVFMPIPVPIELIRN